MVNKYEVVQAKTVEDLTRFVNFKVETGWIPLGPPLRFSDEAGVTSWYQAVTKGLDLRTRSHDWHGTR